MLGDGAYFPVDGVDCGVGDFDDDFVFAGVGCWARFYFEGLGVWGGLPGCFVVEGHGWSIQRVTALVFLHD